MKFKLIGRLKFCIEIKLKAFIPSDSVKRLHSIGPGQHEQDDAGAVQLVARDEGELFQVVRQRRSHVDAPARPAEQPVRRPAATPPATGSGREAAGHGFCRA